MSRLAGALLAAALLAGPAPSSAGPADARPGGSDALSRLQDDPSPKATERLAELLIKTENTDQRFWIVRALSVRLLEHGDPAALDALLDAAGDADPAVRGPALRALTGFRALPETGIGDSLLARLDAAAGVGEKDSSALVRQGAADLRRAIELWRDPSSRKTPPPPERGELRAGVWPRVARLLRWLWLPVVPAAAILWLGLGLPVFDHESLEGLRARAAWEVLGRQRTFLAAAGLVWVCLAALLAGYGFDLLVALLGTPLYDAPGGWLRAYLAAGFCVLAPGALLAAVLARSPRSSAAVASISALPWVLVLSLAAALVLGPLELFYRMFLRRVRAPQEPAGWFDALLWTLETGSLRASYLCAGVMAREGHGLLPGLARARELWPGIRDRGSVGMASFDPRFGLLGAAPVLAILCALVARGLPVEWTAPWPVVLLGCGLWAWGVLAGVLFAGVQALAGVEAAARCLRAFGDEPPAAFGELVRRQEDEEGTS